jgi:hypothetical protein
MTQALSGEEQAVLADDLLIGAEAIARFMFGENEAAEDFLRKKRRTIYWLADIGDLPVFRLGNMICARRSTLLKHFENREQHGSDAAA